MTHPSPVRAQQAWTCHECVVMESSVRHWEISAAVMEPFTSCLLARIRTAAFCRSCMQTRAHKVGYLCCLLQLQKDVPASAEDKEQKSQWYIQARANLLTLAVKPETSSSHCVMGYISYGPTSRSGNKSLVSVLYYE